MHEDPRDKSDRSKLKVYLRFSGAGMQMCIAGVLGAWGGWWLDEKIGTSPIILILGTFLGFTAGFYTLYMELYGRRR